MSETTAITRRDDRSHYSTLMQLSERVDGRMFGCKDPTEMFTLMMLADAEGLHPIHGPARYHIIQGRPAKKADATLADFQAAGGTVEWGTQSDTVVEGTFTHPQGGKFTARWDMERAKQAGMAGKDNWRKHPQQMLRARCITEGVRAVYPRACGIGLYAPEEFGEVIEATVEPAPAGKSEAPSDDAIITVWTTAIDGAQSDVALDEIGKQLTESATVSEAVKHSLRKPFRERKRQLAADKATSESKARKASPELAAQQEAEYKQAQEFAAEQFPEAADPYIDIPEEISVDDFANLMQENGAKRGLSHEAVAKLLKAIKLNDAEAFNVRRPSTAAKRRRALLIHFLKDELAMDGKVQTPAGATA